VVSVYSLVGPRQRYPGAVASSGSIEWVVLERSKFFKSPVRAVKMAARVLKALSFNKLLRSMEVLPWKRKCSLSSEWFGHCCRICSTQYSLTW